MASNEHDYIMTQIRQKAEEKNVSYEDWNDNHESGLYAAVHREDWEDVFEQFEQIEDDLGIDLDTEREFINDIRNPDNLETVNEPSIEEDGSVGEKLKMQRQIKDSDQDEVLAYTDESIGVKHLFNLQEAIYNDSNTLGFVISNQREWDGRVSVKLSDSKVKYELLSVWQDSDGNQSFKHFGGSANKGHNKIEEFSKSFYEYKFRCNDQEYLALSTEELDTVRCKLYGTHISLNDYKTAGENRKLPAKTDVIFVHSVDPAIEVLSTEELENYRENLTHDDLAESLFGGWRQPKWFEQIHLALSFVGDENGYPSHFLWNSEPGTGKSKAVESMLASHGEGIQEPFTGSGSTIKGLVPSFKESPPDEGYLLKTQRLAAVDENMDLLSNTVQNQNARTNDVFRPLLNLLTHDKRSFDSGNGSITGQMTSRMIAVGNWNAYGIRDMEELADKIDDAYLSRTIPYSQTEEHKQFIRDRKPEIKQRMQDEGLTEEDLTADRDDEFLSVIDTMCETNVRLDFSKIQAMHRDLQEMCPGYMLRGKFQQRGDHHLQNLVSGIVKYRYLIGRRDDMEEASQADYELAKDIFEIIVSSWGDVELSKLSTTAQKQALTPGQRRVYNVIDDEPGLTTPQIKAEAEEEQVAWILKDLKEAGLVGVVEDEEGERRIYAHWCEELEHEDDEVLYE